MARREHHTTADDIGYTGRWPHTAVGWYNLRTAVSDLLLVLAIKVKPEGYVQIKRDER